VVLTIYTDLNYTGLKIKWIQTSEFDTIHFESLARQVLYNAMLRTLRPDIVKFFVHYVGYKT
jgi:hypothetical protein